MLAQNLLTLLALALTVHSLPTYHDNEGGLSLSGTAPTTDRDATAHLTAPGHSKPLTSIDSYDDPDARARPGTPAGRPSTPAGRPSTPTGRTSTPTGRPSTGTPTIASSGGDGEGTQNSGNGGQNSGNAAANEGRVGGDYTVEQASQTCGNAQLNCCNKVSKKGDTTNAGLIGSVFGSGDLGIQCTPINIPIIGIQIPINKACDAKAACCQGDTVQNGLVNVGCIALASLI